MTMTNTPPRPQAVAELQARKRWREREGDSWQSALAPGPDRVSDLISESRTPIEPFTLTINDCLKAIRENVLRRRSIEPYCESPIEVDFAAAFVELLAGLSIPVLFAPGMDKDDFGSAEILVIPQWPIERFRFDFLLSSSFSGLRRVLVECDGKEFHSAPEQIANDRNKDAAAGKLGLTVLRFTGAELHFRARECAAHAALELGVR